MVRYAISTCCVCLALRRDPVHPVGDPECWYWFGACGHCAAVRWFEVLALVMYESTPTPILEKET